MKEFNQKNVFITGGSSGIGLATAKLLAERGAHITIFARKKAQLEQSLAEIQKSSINNGQRFNCMCLDVADPNDIQKTMAQAVSDFGVPDLLINSAGVSFALPFEEITPERFDQLMQINVSGTRNVTASIIPHMKKKGGGTVIIVASTAGLIPVYGYSAYGTSKYALVGFAECLRSEMKPENINIQVLCPPEVATPLVEEEQKNSPFETKVIKKLAGTLNVDKTARVFVKGIMKKQFMIIPGFLANLFYYMQRFLPGFMFRSSSDMIVWVAQKIK